MLHSEIPIGGAHHLVAGMAGQTQAEVPGLVREARGNVKKSHQLGFCRKYRRDRLTKFRIDYFE